MSYTYVVRGVCDSAHSGVTSIAIELVIKAKNDTEAAYIFGGYISDYFPGNKYRLESIVKRELTKVPA